MKGFTVIDNKTGNYPDCEKIALDEDWAKHLCYCDIDTFAITEDGSLILMDDCGKCEYCPEGRFTVVTDNNVGTKWISVNDRLPEEDGQYLIFTTQYFTPDHIDEIDHRDGIEISGYYKGFGFLSTNGIYAKYWCELPQPPKGE